VERARFLLRIVLVLYPAFWVLDLVMAPDLAGGFLQIRAAVCVLYLVSLAAVHSRHAERLAQPFVMASSLASAAGISIMSAQLGGFSSNYFAGNMIVLFVINFFLPWELGTAALMSVLIIATDLGINLALYGPSREMVGPLFFLTGSAVFSWLSALSSRRTRRHDLSLRLRLEMANEELKELDRAKSRFFANVSHELRTPLTLLLGPLESLVGETSDPGQQRLFQTMITNARRLLRQVDALLETARLESGRLLLEPAPGNLGRLLGELVAAALPLTERRGIELVTEGLDRFPDGSFDLEKMEIVASNLLSNAFKFTPAGGRVTVRRADAAAGRVAFEVEDSGPGIPQEELERIFDRFHQVEGDSAHGGTGLGLALSRELARLHGGEVAVRSAAGKGSAFRVELPRETQAQPERRRQPRRREDQLVQARAETMVVREVARRSLRETLLADVDLPLLRGDIGGIGDVEPRPEPPAGAPRVLLVEDNEELRSFLAHRLSRLYRVAEAGDGAAGLASARQATPDLIVADVMMPVMDGYELCRRLRADPSLGAVPVILVTARAGAEAVVEGLEVGADDYVVKPFALRELEARIAAQLRARETERQLHERESRLVAIGRMTSSLVHDLRNPLTLLKGYADLAYRMALRSGDTVISGELAQVQAASDRLRRMTEEILDFARGGTPRLQLEPVPARRFLDRALTPLAADLEERGIAAEVHLKLDDELRITLDQDRMQRVLENLLKNAREAVYTLPGERRVFVRAWVEEEDALAIRVADNGPGIAGELADHLFEPFATTGKRQGTGLGLVTVRNLVKAHGGEIRVETASPEGGAAFTVTLPLIPATEEQASETARTVA
jgi:signal transduction histidine kinase